MARHRSSSLVTFFMFWGLIALTGYKLMVYNRISQESIPRLGQVHEAERESIERWVQLLRRYGNNKIQTTRIGCREFDAGAQTCTFEGVICINTANSRRSLRNSVYFIDDLKPSGSRVAHDRYMEYEHRPGTPWHHGPKRWPLNPDTVAPRESGLEASYRTSRILQQSRIMWIPTLWLVDLLYGIYPHNNDLWADIIWILDAQLYRNSTNLLSSPASPTYRRNDISFGNELFAEGPRYVYTPHSMSSIKRQMNNPVNRLAWALVLNLDLQRLYKSHRSGSSSENSKEKALRFFKAYPEVSKRILLHEKIIADEKTDLVCTSRLTTGPKRYDGAHDRVCEHIRRAGYKLFGIPYPRARQVGPLLRFTQPPRHVLVVQRHIVRGFHNLDEVMDGLHAALDPHGVPITLVSTADLVEPESWVRKFAQAGVVITTHGSQSMGQFWMPRYSVFIEIFPLGFYDYCFKFTAQTCGLWYYGLDSMRDPNIPESYFREQLHVRKPWINRNDKAKNGSPVIADVPKLVKTAIEALAKIGHEIDDYIDNVPIWNPNRLKSSFRI